MGVGHLLSTLALTGALAGVAPLSTAGATAGTGTARSEVLAVGVTERTFVDGSRPTAANAACPEIPTRTLPTIIYYPAPGDPSAPPQPHAPPAEGPLPLVVFAHGFGARPASYTALLTHLASRGYVVAAPQFPLSSGASPCGAIAGDVVHQPEDVSFVITSLLDADDPLLDGLVDADAVGAAGHSNGAITTYGLVANSKLRDRRVRAAVALAGTTQPYPRGRYAFAKAPPLLIVHGTDDSLVPYAGAVDVFNLARGPKGLVTLAGGDHGAPAGPGAYPAIDAFLDAYLRDDAGARARLRAGSALGDGETTFAAERGARTTVPTVPRVERDLAAEVTPSKRLTNGQEVTVTWRGYTPGKAVSILQCHGGNRDLSNSAACDYANARLLQPNPTGEGTVTIRVVVGPVGDGHCGKAHPGCFLVVNNESSTDPRNSVLLDLSFAE